MHKNRGLPVSWWWIFSEVVHRADASSHCDGAALPDEYDVLIEGNLSNKFVEVEIDDRPLPCNSGHDLRSGRGAIASIFFPFKVSILPSM